MSVLSTVLFVMKNMVGAGIDINKVFCSRKEWIQYFNNLLIPRWFDVAVEYTDKDIEGKYW